MENFKIYIDRLKHEHRKTLDEIVSPEFLDIQDQALSFYEDIRIQGETYLADDHLITLLNVEAVACIPCSICNESVRIPILLKNLYLSKPLSEIKYSMFD